jgi:cytochrome c553
MRFKTLSALLCGLLHCLAALAADLPLDDGTPNPADLVVREQLRQRLNELAAAPGEYRQALYDGELRATLCKVCHGADGNAVREGTPSLAGQDPVYIVDQLNRYADGRRRDYWMGSLSSTFSDEDKIKLAIFYSEQTMTPARGGDTRLLERGRQLFQDNCSECHGADGRASEGYARLAGQRPEYTIKMLKEFRSPQGRRFNPLMYARAFMLKSEQDIVAVATYLAHLE